MPAALEIDWEAIKQYMMLSGSTFEDAAKEYSTENCEVTHWAIRKRASRELWPLPERVAKKTQELVQRRVQNEQIATATAENWEEKGTLHRGIAFRIAKKAMERVETAPPEVKDWADVERIDKMARRATGLDNDEQKSSNNFTFNLIGDNLGLPPAIEGEFSQEEPGKLPE